ncbi:hypothetical protein G3N59_34765 [Paraburkholderia sp. Ac-20340]|uniref:hypothetical protein n=1 Tax=Paraburkholderia sp. Ac-20340 TaxID=2703888 RepID=UPI00197FEB9B|nr:hypothetical protein [Paraburkholderia sp. Ac-20340]MBN3858564.1 hypothetical protein [Paraburkholderia sp. Ac-20340]
MTSQTSISGVVPARIGLQPEVAEHPSRSSNGSTFEALNAQVHANTYDWMSYHAPFEYVDW